MNLIQGRHQTSLPAISSIGLKREDGPAFREGNCSIAGHLNLPPKETITEIAKWLHSYGIDHLCDRPGAVTVSHTGSLKQTSTLHCFTIHAPSQSLEVFAKGNLWYPENNEGLTEYAHLKKFDSYATSADVGCPRVIGFIDHLNVLVTEKVNGSSLNKWLKSCWFDSKSTRDEAFRIGALCGNWLDTFHAISERTEYRALDQSTLIKTLTRLRDTFINSRSEPSPSKDQTGLSIKLDPNTTRRLEAVVDFLYSRIPNIGLRFVTCHRDFASGNIIRTREGGVVVLDATSNQELPALSDFSYFKVSLQLSAGMAQTPRPIADAMASGLSTSYDIRSGVVPTLDRMDPILVSTFLDLCSLGFRATHHNERLRKMSKLKSLTVTPIMNRLYSGMVMSIIQKVEPLLPPQGQRIRRRNDCI